MRGMNADPACGRASPSGLVVAESVHRVWDGGQACARAFAILGSYAYQKDASRRWRAG